MNGDAVTVNARGNEVAIRHPVEPGLRRGAAVVGVGALVVALAVGLVFRPTLVGFVEAGTFFACAATATIALVCLVFAAYGGDWVVVFDAPTGTVRRELRTFGNLVLVDGFLFDDLGGLCAVRDRDAGDVWQLYLLEAENGRPLHLGNFGDEQALRFAAGAITAVHPGLGIN